MVYVKPTAKLSIQKKLLAYVMLNCVGKKEHFVEMKTKNLFVKCKLNCYISISIFLDIKKP